MNKKSEKFFDELEVVCREHNISISHEDDHGGFVLEKFNDGDMEWLRNASEDGLGEPAVEAKQETQNILTCDGCYYNTKGKGSVCLSEDNIRCSAYERTRRPVDEW